MKRIPLLPVFLTSVGLTLLGAVPAAAQGGLEFGFRGGVSVASASLDTQETFDKSNRTGFAGGVFLNYDAGSLGFQGAVQYTQKGVDLDFGQVVEEFSLSYVEIPVVLKLGIPLGVIKPSVFGGVGLGFKAGCDIDGVDCGDSFEDMDRFGIAGADLAVYLTGISLWVDGRYHFGLSDISEASDVVGDFKHRNWTLQAGIGFGLGG